eukprot:COSAG01_NODE_1900_length_8964_cov_121.219177_11_plen_68_part_00
MCQLRGAGGYAHRITWNQRKRSNFEPRTCTFAAPQDQRVEAASRRRWGAGTVYRWDLKPHLSLSGSG